MHVAEVNCIQLKAARHQSKPLGLIKMLYTHYKNISLKLMSAINDPHHCEAHNKIVQQRRYPKPLTDMLARSSRDRHQSAECQFKH